VLFHGIDALRSTHVAVRCGRMPASRVARSFVSRQNTALHAHVAGPGRSNRVTVLPPTARTWKVYIGAWYEAIDGSRGVAMSHVCMDGRAVGADAA